MNLEDRWNYDYAIDTGGTAMCPECGSHEVWINASPYGPTEWECEDCGYREYSND